MSKLTLSEIIERATQPNLIDVSNFGLCCGLVLSILVIYACARFPETMSNIPKILPSNSLEGAVLGGLLLLSIPGLWSLRQSLRMRDKVRAWEQKEKEEKA